jgi:PKD repeat protein
VIVAVVVGLATLQPKTKPQSVNKPPVASFVYEADNLTVAFNATASNDPDGNITSYSWSFGDEAPNGTGAASTHTYPANGTYRAVLTVTDNGGERNSTSKNITVLQTVTPTAKHYPVALIEVEKVANLTVNVSGWHSYALDGKSIVSYQWSFGDASSASGANITHTYAANGTYRISLNVTDSGGLSNTTAHSVTVAKGVTPPTERHYPVAIIAVEDVKNLTVTVSGWHSHALDGKSIVSYEWNFGDGKNASGANVTHEYAANGTYTITLKVTDSGGLSNSTTRSVTVMKGVTPPPHKLGPPGLLHAIEIHEQKADRNSGLRNSLNHLEENLDEWLDRHGLTP